ncbi:MAG: diaminopimelate epimerase [Actinobacteria bacterium]|nr:MAG: diaminopimelate epimerase [Actinomycetota bacterium]
MRFSKWHALGNSYVVVERGDAGALDADRVRRICDVDRGIGADGVVEVVGIDGTTMDVVIWNPDGSTAEMSGNGTRIAARWLAARGGASEVVVRVGQREVRARMIDALEVETAVGPVEVGAVETIDVHGNAVELTPVAVGNPHAVVCCEEPAREILLRLGPLIETHARFPGRTNVQLAHAEGVHDVRVLVWERGAGETSASGSSAIAAAAAAVARGWCESPVTVHMPGGELVVRIDDGDATLVGPAELVCTGEAEL